MWIKESSKRSRHSSRHYIELIVAGRETDAVHCDGMETARLRADLAISFSGRGRPVSIVISLELLER